jgi:hypothetical protein
MNCWAIFNCPNGQEAAFAVTKFGISPLSQCHSAGSLVLLIALSPKIQSAKILDCEALFSLRAERSNLRTSALFWRLYKFYRISIKETRVWSLDLWAFINYSGNKSGWIPAFAGMTGHMRNSVIPANEHS